MYKSLSSLRESVITKVKKDPVFYVNEDNADALNVKASANNTQVAVKMDGEYIYNGVDNFSNALSKQLSVNDNSANISAMDEETSDGDESIGVQEYLITQPSFYLCNQVSYTVDGRQFDIYMLTYYVNYM